MGDCLNLLHFHLGSQINNIRNIKGAIIELVRVYVEMQRLGAGLKYIDVGGGLGVDYDGSKTDFGIIDQLRPAGVRQRRRSSTSRKSATRPSVEHPTIISESRPGDGRVPQRAGLQRARLERLRPLRPARSDLTPEERGRVPAPGA